MRVTTQLMDEVDAVIARQHAASNAACMVKKLPSGVLKAEEEVAEQLKRHKGNVFSKLAVLHSILDELSRAAKPFIPCKSGCDACCHYNVSVFPVEVLFIERATSHKRLSESLPRSDFHGQRCPFLKDGRCSIYNARPIACRSHIVFTSTAYWCAPDRSNTEKFQLVKFTGIQDALINLATEFGGSDALDIRQWFGTSAR